MEQIGAISEGEWNSFNGMCSEETDFMAQLLGNCSLPNEAQDNSHYPASSIYWDNQESNLNVVGFYDNSIYTSDEINIRSYSFPQGSSYSEGSCVLFPESYYTNMSHQFFVTNNNNNNLTTMGYPNNVMQGGDFLNHDVSNDSVESNENSTEVPMPERMEEEKVSGPSEMSKKRLWIPRDVQRSKRNMKLKESVKVDDDDSDENNDTYKKAVLHRENSISCSEDDFNVLHELNGVVSGSSGALKSNGKTRANRGSATDPQSLYARKRRERINERLRILQALSLMELRLTSAQCLKRPSSMSNSCNFRLSF